MGCLLTLGFRLYVLKLNNYRMLDVDGMIQTMGYTSSDWPTEIFYYFWHNGRKTP